MQLSVWLLTLYCILAPSHGAVEFTPEMDALNYVFGPDEESHQGIDRLHWHEEHLKAVVAILRRMNFVKERNDQHRYTDVWGNLDDDWKMFDMMLDYNIWAAESGLKWDTFYGYVHILEKLRRYVSLEEMTAHVLNYMSRYGSDYIKHIAMDPNLNYTIHNAERFAQAILTFDSPDDLAEIGMSRDQFVKYSEGSRHILLLHREHIEIHLLILETTQQMLSLGLIDHMNEPQHPTRP